MYKATLNSDGAHHILMNELKPCQLAVVVDSSFDRYIGRIIMRTAESDRCIVMDLSDPTPGSFWELDNPIKVRPLQKGESVTLTV